MNSPDGRSLRFVHCAIRGRHSPPKEKLVVGGHRIVFNETQTLRFSQYVNRFKIADTARRIILFQPCVEPRIARRCEVTAIFEGAIEAKETALRKTLAHAAKHVLDIGP